MLICQVEYIFKAFHRGLFFGLQQYLGELKIVYTISGEPPVDFPALFLLSELEVTSIYQENERVRLNQLINITNGNQKVALFLFRNYNVIV